jgi:hypothetical protein
MYPKLSLRSDNDLALLPQIANDYFYPVASVTSDQGTRTGNHLNYRFLI